MNAPRMPPIDGKRRNNAEVTAISAICAGRRDVPCNRRAMNVPVNLAQSTRLAIVILAGATRDRGGSRRSTRRSRSCRAVVPAARVAGRAPDASCRGARCTGSSAAGSDSRPRAPDGADGRRRHPRRRRRLTASHKGQPEITVFPPGHGEPLIKPADRLERHCRKQFAVTNSAVARPPRCAHSRSDPRAMARRRAPRPLSLPRNGRVPASHFGSGMQSSSVKAITRPRANRQPALRAAAGPCESRPGR